MPGMTSMTSNFATGHLQNNADTGRDDDLDAAIKSLKEYFALAQNTDFEIFRFRQARQQPQETLENFRTPMRKLAQTCLFPTDSVDNEIKQ